MLQELHRTAGAYMFVLAAVVVAHFLGVPNMECVALFLLLLPLADVGGLVLSTIFVAGYVYVFAI